MSSPFFQKQKCLVFFSPKKVDNRLSDFLILPLCRCLMENLNVLDLVPFSIHVLCKKCCFKKKERKMFYREAFR